jgi:hypothetical protein
MRLDGLRQILGGVLAALTLTLAPAWAEEVAPVGEVTFAIGAGHINRGSEAINASKGAQIRVGDAIETPEGGHVHIRFIDGAFVSVRPNSRLLIEEYQFDAGHPERSAVKFSLERGTARAISGQAAHAAKDHFRLNTPLVAIGVRGTDFVTQVHSNTVLAVVNQGAIIVAPFDEACLASGLGGCATARSRILTAEMAGVIEYGLHQMAPSIRPGIPKTLDTPALVAPEEASGPATPNQAASNVSSTSASAVATTRSAFVASLPPDNSLMWGRWTFMQGNVNAAPGDGVSVPWNQAAAGRNPSTGNFYAGLFRTENGPVSFPGSLGKTSFGLMEAGVTYTGNNGVAQAGAATGGLLSIDFTNRQFNTQLGLTSPATGAVSLQSSGTVTANGYLVSRAGSPVVAGAVAQDVLRAGYFFVLPGVGGTLSGLTLWGR